MSDAAGYLIFDEAACKRMVVDFDFIGQPYQNYVKRQASSYDAES